MAALDRVKEEVAYLRFWQTIAVATGITLTGWLISASDSATTLIFGLAMGGWLVLSFIALVLHRHIQRRIVQIGEL